LQKYSVSLTEDAPQANVMLNDDPNIRKVQIKEYKVAIVYLADDNRYEVVAVRAYHQMQNPKQYQDSIRERIRKLTTK
jgi:hypothetical protein